MKRLPEWSKEECRLAELLQAEPVQWTAQCYEPMKFVELARQVNDYPDAGAMFEHIAGCAYCTQMYVDTARACQAADAANAPDTPIWYENLFAWLKLPNFRYGIRIGGAALVGVAAMLLLLLPGLRHNSQEELARQAQAELNVADQQAQRDRDQAQRDRDQAQRDKADAERKAAAAADAAKKAADIASAEALPEVSVTVRFQKPDSSDSGYEAIIRNPFRDPVPVSFVVGRPSSGSSKTYDGTVLDSLQATRIGESNGWAFVSGDTLVISQPGHKSSKWVVP